METLCEVRGVQPDAGLRRRWFAGHDCSLFLWENASGEIEAFQFCYETADGEEAVEWRRNREVQHATVIKTSVVGKNRTHGLQFDNEDRNGHALNVFNSCSGKLEPLIVDFVRRCLQSDGEVETDSPTSAPLPPPQEVDDLRKLGGRLI